ncbi:hypothetical protein GW943_03380 [Candidatus Parcubacteria bacterium]|uniref:Small-conductance mechanosensitive ion channel n=1 Tax=Candidatus Kaiserbacteria bacterium CG10_big_fil_rev_8_21_14_0_10_47_16 TaxID=1974608 RepID=A0A2H0UEI3_9BACT|nr:hypothetical protein [Candidatus Parcubacteria bacterium]PIR84819.1 MAG: hypothetical protein COU16_00320 [Candidatus Kaiserbacteria bacterium CG10_big_fil_rev_8_21_14_0_10_47_16]
MEQNLITVLEMSFRNLWSDIILFLPQMIIALLVVIIGWIIADVLKRLIEKLFVVSRANEALAAAGIGVISKRAGYNFKPGQFVGSLVKWFVIIVFIVAALDILNLGEITVFFRDVVLNYLPRVIVAVLIIFGAMIIAQVVSASVEAGARAAGFRAAEMLGAIARYAIIVFAVLAALSQLEIAPMLVQILFAGFVFATSLAFGLAFGLGGRDMASKYLSKVEREVVDHHHG